ncbi:MAG: flagellar basal body rod protein FlgB [Candidatus Zixiibacteriota bacterium]
MANTISKFLFDRVGIPKMQTYLDLGGLRQKLIGGNIANVATPGFESADINFEKEFSRLTGKSNRLEGMVTHPSHIPTGNSAKRPPKVETVDVKDGELNSVNMDQQIAGMAQNEITYTVGAQLLKQRLDGLRKVITSK